MEQVNEYTLAVGQQVKKYRIHQDLTREELSTKSGIPLEALARIESGVGEVNGPDIMKAATALNVSARAIFGRALLGNEFVRADCPGEDTAAMGKMYTAALDYFAAMRLVSP